MAQAVRSPAERRTATAPSSAGAAAAGSVAAWSLRRRPCHRRAKNGLPRSAFRCWQSALRRCRRRLTSAARAAQARRRIPRSVPRRPAERRSHCGAIGFSAAALAYRHRWLVRPMRAGARTATGRAVAPGTGSDTARAALRRRPQPSDLAPAAPRPRRSGRAEPRPAAAPAKASHRGTEAAQDRARDDRSQCHRLRSSLRPRRHPCRPPRPSPHRRRTLKPAAQRSATSSPAPSAWRRSAPGPSSRRTRSARRCAASSGSTKKSATRRLTELSRAGGVSRCCSLSIAMRQRARLARQHQRVAIGQHRVVRWLGALCRCAGAGSPRARPGVRSASPASGCPTACASVGQRETVEALVIDLVGVVVVGAVEVAAQQVVAASRWSCTTRITRRIGTPTSASAWLASISEPSMASGTTSVAPAACSFSRSRSS